MPFYSIAPGCLLVEAASAAAFPATGAANTFYVALDTNMLYRWAGSAYAVVSASPEEVIEGASASAFPATGEAGKLYVAIDTGKAYRWTGSVYTEVSSSPVTSVAGKTGAVTLAKGDVGLSNVDNTSDANKPVSTATQTALDGKANASHSHAIADVSGLQTALDGKQASGSYADATHSHAIADVSGLQDALDGKQEAGSYAESSHTHDAADITTGVFSTALLGTGTASSDAFLRGDGTWAAVVSTLIDGGSASTIAAPVLDGGTAAAL